MFSNFSSILPSNEAKSLSTDSVTFSLKSLKILCSISDKIPLFCHLLHQTSPPQFCRFHCFLNRSRSFIYNPVRKSKNKRQALVSIFSWVAFSTLSFYSLHDLLCRWKVVSMVSMSFCNFLLSRWQNPPTAFLFPSQIWIIYFIILKNTLIILNSTVTHLF